MACPITILVKQVRCPIPSCDAENSKPRPYSSLDQCEALYQNQGVSYFLTPRALTSPFSPKLSAFRQSGQYHLVVLAGMLDRPTHSRWNHSILQFYIYTVSRAHSSLVFRLQGKHLHHYRTESWCQSSHGCTCSTVARQGHLGFRRLVLVSLRCASFLPRRRFPLSNGAVTAAASGANDARSGAFASFRRWARLWSRCVSSRAGPAGPIGCQCGLRFLACSFVTPRRRSTIWSRGRAGCCSARSGSKGRSLERSKWVRCLQTLLRRLATCLSLRAAARRRF